VATHILELTPDGVRDFAGSYQEYLEKFGDDHLNREQPLSTTIAQTAAPQSAPQELSYDKRKKMQREISKLKKQAIRFESLVEETELKISAIEAKFSLEDFYQQTSADEVQKLQTEKSELNDQLSKNLRQWETSSQNLESLEESFGA
jgi:uncharacterized protein YdcH (DUF465 family)